MLKNSHEFSHYLWTRRPSKAFFLCLLFLMFVSLSGCASKSLQDNLIADTPLPAPEAEKRQPSADPLVVPASTEIAQSEVITPPAESDSFKTETQDPWAEDYGDSALVVVPDPLYHWNRFWFRFNDLLMRGLLSPIVQFYNAFTPEFLRVGIRNMYHNIQFPKEFASSLLQFDLTKASRAFGRFFINTVFGVGGFFDLAKSDPNLQPQDEDIGKALAKWGIGEGFYLVLPILGPTTARDAFGLIGDMASYPGTYVFDPSWIIWYNYSSKVGGTFNDLSFTLSEYEALIKASIDPYSAVRDAYVQMRREKAKK